MTEAMVALAAGCLLERFEAEGDLASIGVLAEKPGCDRVELRLPPGVALGEHSGKEKRSDDTRVRLDEARWERLPLAVDGSSGVRVHLPDLLQGDRVALEVELVRPEAPARPLAPPGDVRVEERLVLQVPPGDPQVRLYPGGGSSVTVERHLVFAPADRDRGWPVEAPATAEVRLASEPSGAAELVHEPAGWRVAVLASEGTSRVTVSWDEPDAPTYGERRPEVDRLVVDAPGGDVRWEGDGWTLMSVNDRVVLPGRDILVKALDARFRGVALPEPGAPMSLRGREPSWELAAELRPTVLERAPVGSWPSDPLWPRKLVKARKSGALTPGEAALIVWLYARQLRLDADWAVVRPATAGPGQGASPAGYTRPLVRVRIADEERWIDPACTVCGPFEVPPELEGASALGTGIESTPPPTRGRQQVTWTAETVEWRLEGPPALLLRLWLQGLPASDRGGALAGRIGGPGARLLEAEGVETAARPIRVLASRGQGLAADPLALPVPRGTSWVDWIGERVLVRPAGGDVDARLESGPLTWTRTVADGVATETLLLTDRHVPADAVHSLDTARSAPPPTPPEPVPLPL